LFSDESFGFEKTAVREASPFGKIEEGTLFVKKVKRFCNLKFIFNEQ